MFFGPGDLCSRAATIRLLDLITVEDATGAEYDIGELVTYLNDAVLIARQCCRSALKS